MDTKLVPQHYIKHTWYDVIPDKVTTTEAKDIRCFGVVATIKPYEDFDHALHLATEQFVDLHSSTILAWMHDLDIGDREMAGVTYSELQVLEEFLEGGLPAGEPCTAVIPSRTPAPPVKDFCIVELCKPMYFELARLGPDRRFLFLHYFRVEKK